MPSAVAIRETVDEDGGRSGAVKRRRPPLWLEQRAAFELAELIASPVYYGIGVPRGDGTPVLL